MVCPKQGPKIEGNAVHKEGILSLFCSPKQGQVFISSAAPLYPNIGHVPPSPGTRSEISEIERLQTQGSFRFSSF